MDNNPYKAPESEQRGYQEVGIIDQLRRQQSYVLAIIISFAATSGLLYYFATYIGEIPMFAFVAPGFLCGLLVKIIARPYSMLARAVPATVCALLVFVYFYSTELSLFALILPFFNFLICLGISRRLMSHEQESALYKLRNKL